jgi:hypothetical protein
VIALTLLAVMGSSGCTVLFTAAAQSARSGHEKRSRRDATSLSQLKPGSWIAVKPRHRARVNGKFVGVMPIDSVSAVDSTAVIRSGPGDEPVALAWWLSRKDAAPEDRAQHVVLLRVYAHKEAIPVDQVEWVQNRASDVPVLVSLGIGLAVDVAILVALARAVSGLGAAGS